MNKNYLRYLFKSKKTLLMFITIIELLLCISIRVANHINFGEDIAVSGMSTFAVINFGLSIVLPFYMTRFVHSKKMSDTYFSLPMTRKELLTSDLIFEFVTIAIPVILCTLLVSLGVPKTYDVHYSGVLVIILLELGAVFVSLVFNTLFCLITNTTLDALVINFAYHALPFVVMATVYELVDTYVYGYSPLDFVDLLWLSADAQIIKSVMLGFDVYMNGLSLHFLSDTEYLCSILYTVIVGALAVYGDYKLLNERKAEMAEEKSNNPFAYPMIRHFYMACLIALIVALSYVEQEWTVGIILSLLVITAYLASGFLYERKIVIKKSNIVFACLIVLSTIAVSFIGVKTKGFGLSYGVSENFEQIQVSYTYYSFYDDVNLSDEENEKYNPREYNYVIDLHKLSADKEFMNDLERLQKKCIDEHYRDGWVQGNNGYLNIYLFNKDGRIVMAYNYNNISSLDVESEAFFKKYGTIQVQYYNSERDEYVNEIIY